MASADSANGNDNSTRSNGATGSNTVTRRAVLTAGASGLIGVAALVGVAGSGGALVAGCGLGSDCDTWSAGDEPRTKPSTLPSGQQVLADLDDIAPGTAITARTAKGDPVIIARPTDTTAVAFSAKCTHNGCLVKPNGNGLLCPPHDGRFNVTTGQATGGPPKKALKSLDVAVIDGKVVLFG